MLQADELWAVLLLSLPRPAHWVPRDPSTYDIANDPWYFDAYQEPPPPSDFFTLTDNKAARVELMRGRAGRGEAIFHRQQINVAAFAKLARQAINRGRNGNDITAGKMIVEGGARHVG